MTTPSITRRFHLISDLIFSMTRKTVTYTGRHLPLSAKRPFLLSRAEPRMGSTEQPGNETPRISAVLVAGTRSPSRSASLAARRANARPHDRSLRSRPPRASRTERLPNEHTDQEEGRRGIEEGQGFARREGQLKRRARNGLRVTSPRRNSPGWPGEAGLTMQESRRD